VSTVHLCRDGAPNLEPALCSMGFLQVSTSISISKLRHNHFLAPPLPTELEARSTPGCSRLFYCARVVLNYADVVATPTPFLWAIPLTRSLGGRRTLSRS
jgi:hypothetical protein